MAGEDQRSRESMLSERSQNNLPWLSTESVLNIARIALGQEHRSGTTYKAPDSLRLIGALVYSIRPWQWYKQGILLIAILFSGNLFNLTAWSDVLHGIVAFCFVAGGIYTLNDIFDREADRQHPTKRHRPIAKGTLGLGVASLYATLLLLVGGVLSIQLGWAFALVVGAYVAQNLVYSLYLKHVLFVDILLIALGFVWRAIAGVAAIGAELSAWLVVCAFLAALMLALGKRRAELSAVDDVTDTRPALDGLSARHFDDLMLITAGTLLMAYTLYTVMKPNSLMMATLPFAFFGVFLYYILVQTTAVTERPERLLVNRAFLANLGLWVITVVAVIYVVPDHTVMIQ